MKRKVWILVQQLLPKRNSESWEPNRQALAYEPWNMSVRLRGRCWLADKFGLLSEQIDSRRSGSYYLDAETSSVSSIFIARGYLRSNAQNRHPFHHLPSKSRRGVMKGLPLPYNCKIYTNWDNKAVFVTFHGIQKWFSSQDKKWRQTREGHFLGWTIKVKTID